MFGQRGASANKLTGWQCFSEAYHAKITKSMSDHTIKLDFCEEIHDIVIG